MNGIGAGQGLSAWGQKITRYGGIASWKTKYFGIGQYLLIFSSHLKDRDSFDFRAKYTMVGRF